MRLLQYLVMLSFLGISSCTNGTGRYATRVPGHVRPCLALKSLAIKKQPAVPGTWRYQYPEDGGQSVSAYLEQKPLETKNRKLYLVKIGAFDSASNEIFSIAQRYLAHYFLMPTDTLSQIAISAIPENKKRMHEGELQLQTTFILQELLTKLKPDDAFAVIAFTITDLFPDENWNFVFGQADLKSGVGIWSIARFGNGMDEAAFPLVLARTLKTAAHETGHILGMQHCVKNECSMNGTLSLQESDAQVEWLCWECMAKVCYNRGCAPQTIIHNLLVFHQKIGSDRQILDYYARAKDTLKAYQP
jgi:archaemetzincin